MPPDKRCLSVSVPTPLVVVGDIRMSTSESLTTFVDLFFGVNQTDHGHGHKVIYLVCKTEIQSTDMEVLACIETKLES